MPTTTTNGAPYPLGTDPLGETDLRIKALAEFVDDRLNTRAKVYAGAAQTLTTGVAAVVAFNSEETDAKALHSTAVNTSRVTAAVAGRYEVKGQCAFVSNATGYRQVALLKNGAAFASVRVPTVSGASTNLQVVGSVALAATDYVELQVLQTSGGNLDTVAGQANTWLDVTLTGAV